MLLGKLLKAHKFRYFITIDIIYMRHVGQTYTKYIGFKLNII